MYTSNADPLLDNTPDYFINGAGLAVSHYFGFGAIDGEALITRAQQWTNVPSQIVDAVVPSVDFGLVLLLYISNPLTCTPIGGFLIQLEQLFYKFNFLQHSEHSFVNIIDFTEVGGFIPSVTPCLHWYFFL